MDCSNLGRADFYYLGSFDDQIQRYQTEPLNLEFINASLACQALFGGKLLISDGYLLLYPDGLLSLTRRKVSPLLHLLDEGYINILTKNEGRLAELPYEMAPKIDSYRNLIKTRHWKEAYPRLRDLQEKLRQQNAFRKLPPKNLGPGFASLVNKALERYDKQTKAPIIEAHKLQRILDEFNGRMRSDANTPARQEWCRVFESEEWGLSPEALNFLNRLGIEAYHYNLAMVAESDNPRSRPGVVTSYSSLFDDYRERISAFSTDGVFAGNVPRPAISAEITRSDLMDGDFLARIVCPGEDLCNAKHDYLIAAQDARQNKDAFEEAENKADAYAAEIEKYFKVPRDSSNSNSNIALDYVGITAGGVAEAFHEVVHSTVPITSKDQLAALVVRSFAKPLIGAIVKFFASTVAEQRGLPNPTTVDLLDLVHPDGRNDETQAPILLPRQTFASIMINPDVAFSHARVLPEFKHQ